MCGTEVCKLVVHRRRQIGSGSQAHEVRLSESKARLTVYTISAIILPIALDNHPTHVYYLKLW